MSYTVLARKFRSQTFDEVVGQEAVTTTIRNAILRDRVHHGYLFCGTRGVGKTSMARILAKALNCQAYDGPTATPCNKCDSCISIAQGDDVDVIEIDAASNTGVDNIRELRSNAIYRPARSRFKIYIIDEVHMLSAGAFNALLKTLEEPPGHVKFIFATTESHKIPATIVSRVQRFDFKSIPPADISAQISRICEAEGIQIDDAASKRLARLARGSMRDALSLLDQVLSMPGGQVTSEIVDEMFPAAHDELFAELIDRFSENDAAGSLEIVDRSIGHGHTLDNWCSLLIDQLRDLMILRVCGDDTDLVDVPAALRPKLVQQARRFDSGTFVHMITVLEELRRSVKSSGSGRALVEAAMIRLAEASNYSSIESLLAQVKANPGARGAGGPSRPTPAKKNNAATRPESSSPAGGTAAPAPAAPKSRDISRGAVQAPSNRAPQSIPTGRRTTQADIKAAQADPVVQQALDLFGGQIVEVQRPESKSSTPSDESTG